MTWALTTGLILGGTIYAGIWAGERLVAEHYEVRVLRAEVSRLADRCR